MCEDAPARTIRASAHASPAAVGKARGLLGSKPAAAVGKIPAACTRANLCICWVGWYRSAQPPADGSPLFPSPVGPFSFSPLPAEAVVRSLRSLRNGGRTKGGTKAGVCALAPIKKKPLSRSPAPPCQGPFFVGARLPRTNRSPQLKPGPSGLRNVARPPGVLGAAATRAAALGACLQPGRAAPRPRAPGRHPPSLPGPHKKRPLAKNLCVPQLKGVAALRGRYFAGRFALAPWWRPGWPFGVRAARAPAWLFFFCRPPPRGLSACRLNGPPGRHQGQGQKAPILSPGLSPFPGQMGPLSSFFPAAGVRLSLRGDENGSWAPNFASFVCSIHPNAGPGGEGVPSPGPPPLPAWRRRGPTDAARADAAQHRPARLSTIVDNLQYFRDFPANFASVPGKMLVFPSIMRTYVLLPAKNGTNFCHILPSLLCHSPVYYSMYGLAITKKQKTRSRWPNHREQAHKIGGVLAPLAEKERFELSNGFTRYTISSRAYLKHLYKWLKI